MTPEQKYDRLERIARLMYEGALRASRESSKQTAQLQRYVEARKEYDVAKKAFAERPNDADAAEILRCASERLEEARARLRR